MQGGRAFCEGQLLFSSCGLAPAGEIKGAKSKLINFTKLMKFGFLLSHAREWHMKPGKEEKQSRHGEVVSGSQVAGEKEGKETAAYAMRNVLIKIIKKILTP